MEPLFGIAMNPVTWLIVGGVALLLFGNRLPSVARSFGKSVVEFKKGMKEIEDDLESDSDSGSSKKKSEE